MSKLCAVRRLQSKENVGKHLPHDIIKLPIRIAFHTSLAHTKLNVNKVKNKLNIS